MYRFSAFLKISSIDILTQAKLKKPHLMILKSLFLNKCETKPF